MPGERINVVNASGLVQSIPAEQAALAASEGWQIASDEQASAAIEQKEVMSRQGAGFDAAFEGVGRALTFGGTDWVLSQIVDDEERRRMQVRSLSDEAGYGELGGTALSLATGAGAFRALGAGAARAGAGRLLGAAGRGALAADAALGVTPAVALSRGAAVVGEAVEAGIIGKGTASVARSALARGAGLAAEGAIEGAAMGAGDELSEASLGGRELSGQKLLAGAGEGALFGAVTGGALGAGLGAGGTVLSRLLQRGGDEVIEDLAHHIAPEIGKSVSKSGKLVDLASSVSSKLSGKSAEDIALGLSSPKARQDMMRFAELRDEAVKRTTKTLDAMKRLEQVEKRLASGDWKAANVGKTVKRGESALGAQRAAAGSLVDDIAAQLEKPEMLERLGASSRRELMGVTKQARKALAEAASSADPAVATHAAMDEFKRGVSDLRQNASDAIAASRVTPMKPAARRQMQELLEFSDVYGSKAKGLLEDTNIWGAAGANQSERNAAISKMLRTKGDFDGRFFQRMKETSNGRRLEIADPNKAQTYFNQLNDWRKDFAHQQTLRHIDDRLELYDVLQRNGEIPEELVSEFQEAKKLAGQLKVDFSEMGERISNANRLKGLAEQDAFDRMVGGASGALMGTIAGGPVGGAIGFAVDALRNPGAIVQKIAAIESLAQRIRRVDNKVTSSIKAFVKQETAPELSRLPTREARRKLKARNLTVAGATKTGLAVSKDSERRRLERKADEVRAFAADPIPATEAFMSRATRGVSSYAPGVVSEVAKTQARAMQFLRSKLPERPITQSSIMQPNIAPLPMTSQQADAFQRYVDAVEKPLDALDAMREGTLSPETVEAIKFVYPDLWGDMRSKAMLEVAGTKEPLSHTAVVRLSLMFDFAGAPTLTPEFQAMHNAIMEKRAEAEAVQSPPPSAQRPANPAPTTQTLSQRLSVSM